jgi:uncharacterized protein (TIGR02646 family)
MPGDVKSEVLRRLLQEQGWICGYTGVRIAESTSHIEHIYPQTLCRQSDEGVPALHGARRDIDYRNVIAAFPKGDIEWRDRYPFGARSRRDWYDEALFVHPLRVDCEKQFLYGLSGTIEPADGAADGPAATTIRMLNLDDRRRDVNGDIVDNGPLTDMRRAAIEALFFDDDSPVSASQIQTIVRNIFQPEQGGQLSPFCFVLKQAGEELLRNAARERKRRKVIEKQERQQRKTWNR